MKKILCFLIVPVIFILTRIPLVKDPSQLISFGVFIVVNFAVSLLFCIMLCKINFTLGKSIFAAVFLAVADQAVKIIVYKFAVNLRLVGNILRIEPTENRNQTALFNYLGLELDRVFIIIFKAVLVLLLFVIFVMLKNKSAYLWRAGVLFLSTGLTNFVDSAAWGYTLDYVYFSRLTCYYLKDFYVDTAIGFLLMEIIGNYKRKAKNSSGSLSE